MRRKITFLLTFLVAVLIIALAGGRVYAETGYEVEDYANQDFCYVNQDTGYEAVIVDDAFLLSVSEKSMLLEKMTLYLSSGARAPMMSGQTPRGVSACMVSLGPSR